MVKKADTLSTIESIINQNRLPHAILLHGQSISELEAHALHIARILLKDPVKDNNHPDLFLLRPANKMRQISVENTRKLIHDIQHSPHQAERKVTIIYEVDRMHISAANALLKTLEEPPADTTLILLTTQPYRVLETIKSRSIQFRFEATEEFFNHEKWLNWEDSYINWLQKVTGPLPQASDRSTAIIGLYGLIERFLAILEELSDKLWEEKSKNNNPNQVLDEDVVIAEQVGFQKNIRHTLFRKITETTHQFAISYGTDGILSKWALVNKKLEALFKLLDYNMNEGAVLESFFLQSLRTWNAKS